jgi:hypothetical protein
MRAHHIEEFLASFVGRRADQDIQSRGKRRDDFPTAFRAARGTISTDLDIES